MYMYMQVSVLKIDYNFAYTNVPIVNNKLVNDKGCDVHTAD